jgi:hypothetical protein
MVSSVMAPCSLWVGTRILEVLTASSSMKTGICSSKIFLFTRHYVIPVTKTMV